MLPAPASSHLTLHVAHLMIVSLVVTVHYLDKDGVLALADTHLFLRFPRQNSTPDTICLEC